MARFRMDNTEGYNQSELDQMNVAFDAVFCACTLSSDSKSWQDHLAEKVQFAFDAGFRGSALIDHANHLPE